MHKPSMPFRIAYDLDQKSIFFYVEDGASSVTEIAEKIKSQNIDLVKDGVLQPVQAVRDQKTVNFFGQHDAYIFRSMIKDVLNNGKRNKETILAEDTEFVNNDAVKEYLKVLLLEGD